MTNPTHISILGKSEINREGLRRILADEGFVIDAAESSALDFGPLPCDVIIVDAHTIDEGLQSCCELHDRFPTSRIVLMMDRYQLEDVAQAFASGAVDGYLIKAMSCAPLAGALRLIAMGQKVLPSEVAESLTQSIPPIVWSGRGADVSDLPLSTREIEILRHLLGGHPNKVISRSLGIADATVKVHIKAILRKLNVQNRTQAAIWAANRGLASMMPAVPAHLLPLQDHLRSAA